MAADPAVYFDEDLDELLKTKPRTRRRLQKQGAWPIPELATATRSASSLRTTRRARLFES